MGMFFLLGLLGMAVGAFVIDDILDDDDADDIPVEDDVAVEDDVPVEDDPQDPDTPPVEGETFDLDGVDDPTEGTAGDDIVNINTQITAFDAGGGDDLIRVAPPTWDDWDDIDNRDGGDPIGPVLTGGEGEDIFLLNLDDQNSTDHNAFLHYQPKFEITDFDPEQDHLALTPKALYEWEYYNPEPYAYGTHQFPLDEIAIEHDPNGAYIDVVLMADTGADEAQEFTRIRLWGVDDFDPANILIATGELDEDGNEIFVPIEISDGTPTGVGDDTALYGHDGSDIVQLDGTSGSHIFTRDGDDTVTGTAETTEIYTGDGNDTVSLTGSGLGIHGGAGNDSLSATEGDLWGDAGDDTLTHLDSGGGDATLNGGLGHDTLIGQSGDTFIGGEDIIIDIDDALDPGTSHGTTVWYDDGYDSNGINLDHTGAPFDGSFEDGTLTLNFPEGTTGTLHIVNEQGNGTDPRTITPFSINEVFIYYVPEGEVFDPDDLSNATQVANLRLDIVTGPDAHDAFTFPDYDTYLASNLPVGSVQTVTFDTDRYTY